MNNDQSDCPKCHRKFHNKGSLAHHLEACREDQQKISEEQDPLALDVPGDDKIESGENVVIEILDTPEEPLTHVGSPPSIPAARKVFQAPQISRGGGKGKVGRLDCYYCGVTTSDRISLTKHLVAQHWAQVRDRQGGGRKDNRHLYSNLQDSRVLQPGLNHLARTGNYRSGNLPPPNRKIFPKPTPPAYNWTARIRDKDFQRLNQKVSTSGAVLPSGSNFSNSFFGKTQNRKIMPKLSYSGTASPTVSRSSNSFFGKTPNRKFVPKTSNNVLTGRPASVNSAGLTEAKRSIPSLDLTRPARSTIPNTNHRSFNKVRPNSELDKLVKKFANSNSNLQITKVSK